MKTQEMFVSVDEKALESVAGGLLDIGNGSANGNTIKLLSGLCADVKLGDILSNILNLGNQVTR